MKIQVQKCRNYKQSLANVRIINYFKIAYLTAVLCFRTHLPEALLRSTCDTRVFLGRLVPTAILISFWKWWHEVRISELQRSCKADLISFEQNPAHRFSLYSSAAATAGRNYVKMHTWTLKLAFPKILNCSFKFKKRPFWGNCCIELITETVSSYIFNGQMRALYRLFLYRWLRSVEASQ